MSFGKPDPNTLRLGELAGTWLMVYCEIPAHGRIFRIDGLAEKHGPDRALGELLPRFRCKHCGSRPARIVLQETAYGTAQGMAGFEGGWSIEILLETHDEQQGRGHVQSLREQDRLS